MCISRHGINVIVCVCPAFTVLGGKKTKKEGHHKEFLDALTSINPRKGHRSVLHPVLWPGSVWPVFVVSVSTVWCVAVSAWTRRRFIDCCTAAAPTKSLTWHSSTPANTATLSSQGETTLAKFHRAWRWRRPVSSVLIVCSFQQGEGTNSGLLWAL